MRKTAVLTLVLLTSLTCIGQMWREEPIHANNETQSIAYEDSYLKASEETTEEKEVVIEEPDTTTLWFKLIELSKSLYFIKE